MCFFQSGAVVVSLCPHYIHEGLTSIPGVSDDFIYFPRVVFCRVESISIGLYQEQQTEERVSSRYSSPSQVVSACLQGGTGIRRWYGRRYRYESIWGWQNHPQTGILGRTCSNTTGRAGF